MPPDVRDLTSETFLAKAGGLLHSLVPRAQVFCFYDTHRVCVWSSDSAEDYEIDNFVADVPDELLEPRSDADNYLRRTLISGRTVLGYSVHGHDRTPLGILVVLFTRNAGKSSSFNPALLQTILQPAVEMIGESLHLIRRVRDMQHRVGDVEKEIELVYEIDDKVHGVSGRHQSLAELVGRSGRHLGINYSVLLIPGKRIRISATHSSWKGVDRKVLDRYVVDQLLPKLEGQRHPLVFEIAAVDGAGNDGGGSYQALLCPVLGQQGNVEGVLAQLGRINNGQFGQSDRRFMSHIGRKVEYVIERSFDAMTGLMNRSGFETQLYESFAALKDDNDAHQLIYFDLDSLQLVNDSFGRDAGDEVILRFATMLAADLPKSGVLARLTGDDFCMLLTHADSDAALEYANTIRDNVKSLRYLQGDKSLQVTMSVGISEVNRYGGEEGDALTTARMACEAAKDGGRDRIEIFDSDNRSVIRRYDDMQLVADIQQALDSDGFELFAQPIAALKSTPNGPRYEVLIRMPDGQGGYISTAAFISAAERYRIMPQIDRWVASTTITQLALHADSLQDQNAMFAVNLSGQSLGDHEILNFIEEEIDQSGLPASLLCFEITESAAVSNMKKAQAFIDRLRERGCTIALDDFGAGLSSFAYLKKFSVDTLKIDGGFIRDITRNRISESMVAAITQVAKVMELETVAEYVESKATFKLLKTLRVDFAQGHYVGKPTLLDNVVADLADTSARSTA